MNKRIAKLELLPLLLLLPIFAAGCDKATNPVAPSGSVISISANPSRITLNGQSTLTITGFRPDGNRLNPGTQITLSATIGTLSNSIVEIGSDGFTSAILRGDGREGSADVTARLTTAGAGDTGSKVSVAIGASAPKVLIIVSESELDPNQRTFVTFIARDENSLPLGAGEVIQVAASRGSILVNSREVTSVTTGSDGRAVAEFVAGEFAGKATISAFLRNSEVATSDITIRDVASNFELTLDKGTASDGDTIRLTVVVSNPAGRPAQGILVIFGVDGASGSFSSSSQNTGTEGEASSTFTFEQGSLNDGDEFELNATVVINGVSVTKSKTVEVQGG